MSADLSNQIVAIEKEANGKADSATEARLEELATQSEKLRFHSRYNEGEVPAAHLKRIERREEYARHLARLSKEGVRNPRNEVSSIKMVIEINRPEVEEAIRAYKSEIAANEANLKSLVNPTEEEKAYYVQAIARQQERLLDEQAVLEFSNILASDGAWDSTTGKSQRLAQLQDELGRRLWANAVDSKAAEVKMYEEYLKETGLGEATLAEYRKLKEEAAADLKKYKSETAQDIRLRGHEQINKIRYKY
jgi:hypothetical protein